ncbi:MAG: glyoxalase, partial [Gammaproteobacteria bacterium]
MKILDLKAFLPSKDFSVSRHFYRELGFAENFANADVAEFEIGGFRFLLQDRYVAEWAGNFMM